MRNLGKVEVENVVGGALPVAAAILISAAARSPVIANAVRAVGVAVGTAVGVVSVEQCSGGSSNSSK